MADPRARVILEAVRRGDAAFASFQADLERVGTTAKYIAGAVVGALTLITIASAESIDVLTDQADAIGVTTEALAGLQLAAKVSGVDSEQLQKALIKQTQAIYDASTGSKKAQETFEALGLSWRDLIKLSPDEQFRLVADAIKEVDNVTQRAGLTADVFGAKNLQLINTLMLGTEGLQEYADMAEYFGTAISRVDAAKVQAATDAIDLAREKVKGFGNVIAVELSPFVTELADAFLGVGGSADQMAVQVRRAIDIVAQSLGVVLDIFYGWQLVIGVLREALLDFGAVAASSLGAIVGVLDKIQEAWIKTLLVIVKAQEFVTTLGGALDTTAGIESVRTRLEGMLTQANAESDFLAQVAESLAQSSDEAGEMWRALAAAQKPSEAIAEAMARIRSEAQTAAVAAAEVAASAREGGGGEVATVGDDAAAKSKQRIADELERLRVSWLSKEQIEAEALARRQTMLDAARQTGLIEDERYFELSAELSHRHWAAMEEIQAASLEAQRIARLQEFQASLGVVASVFSAMASLAAVNADRSKKSFDFNKQIGIANALVSTAVGVAKALEGPFPWNLVNAAVVAAAGLAQVNAIRSTSWSGGGAAGGVAGGGGGGGGGAAAASTASPVYQAERDERRKEPSQVVYIVTGAVGRVERADAERIVRAIREVEQEDF